MHNNLASSIVQRQKVRRVFKYVLQRLPRPCLHAENWETPTICVVAHNLRQALVTREPWVQRTPCWVQHLSSRCNTVHYWIIHRAGMKNSSWENWVKTFNQAWRKQNTLHLWGSVGYVSQFKSDLWWRTKEVKTAEHPAHSGVRTVGVAARGIRQQHWRCGCRFLQAVKWSVIPSQALGLLFLWARNFLYIPKGRKGKKKQLNMWFYDLKWTSLGWGRRCRCHSRRTCENE